MNRSRLLLLGLGVALIHTAAAAAEPGDADPNQACAECHDEITVPFASSVHGAAATGRDYGTTLGTCTSCHGESAEHLRSQGRKAPTRTFRDVDADQASEACLACHDRNPAQLNWDLHGGLSCLGCHAVHKAPAGASHLLARGNATDTCSACHADLKRVLTQRSRHPLAEGKMDCASCHDPHGQGTAEHLVRANSNTELCVSCHAEKRGPHLWEHAPVREDCASCHTPHGSNHESLLVTQPARLCQQCHMQGRHQTVAGMPNEPWNFNRSCMNCHPAIHGSNHPSGVLFQR